MNTALIFKDGEPVLVTAKEVFSGKYGRYEYEFVDPEYNFKVKFVCGAKNGGGPYFRLYYSYEDYKKLYPERADRYQIVANMRRFQECKWHREWKAKFSDSSEIEKWIKNPNNGKYKYADAFLSGLNTCIEFQHSYIALNFEERNTFYADLGIKVVWLYDLPKANIKETPDGYLEILEDNARGFFRISETPDNLKNNYVYIQVKSGMIYRVKELQRKLINSNYKSTIRYFVPSEIYTEDDFIAAVKDGTIFATKSIEDKKPIDDMKSIVENSFTVSSSPHSVWKSMAELWKPNYISMRIQDMEDPKKQVIMVNTDGHGNLFRNENGCIIYQYVKDKGYTFDGRFCRKEYLLSREKEHAQIWREIGHNERIS